MTGLEGGEGAERWRQHPVGASRQGVEAVRDAWQGTQNLVASCLLHQNQMAWRRHLQVQAWKGRGCLTPSQPTSACASPAYCCALGHQEVPQEGLQHLAGQLPMLCQPASVLLRQGVHTASAPAFHACGAWPSCVPEFNHSSALQICRLSNAAHFINQITRAFTSFMRLGLHTRVQGSVCHS